MIFLLLRVLFFRGLTLLLFSALTLVRLPLRALAHLLNGAFEVVVWLLEQTHKPPIWANAWWMVLAYELVDKTEEPDSAGRMEVDREEALRKLRGE